MAQLRIVDVRKTIATGGARLGQLETLVSYADETNQFFLLVIPKGDPTETEIVDAIKKDSTARGSLIGKTITH